MPLISLLFSGTLPPADSAFTLYNTSLIHLGDVVSGF